MPEGEIIDYDPEEQHGLIEPEDESDPLPFTLDEVEDYHVGERIGIGQRVTFEVDEDDWLAYNVQRIGPIGYA